MQSRTWLAPLAAMALAGGLLAGCGDDDKAKTDGRTAAAVDTGPIVVSIPFESYFAPPIEEAAKICAPRGVEIEIKPVNADYLDHNLKLQVAAQSGNVADLAVQGLLTVGSMGQSDFNPDLTQYIEGSELFDPEVLPLLAVGQANGKQAAIPWGVSLPVIWVNADRFREVGLDPDTPFETWADVAEAAKKLTDGTRTGIAFGQAEGWVQLNQLLIGGSNIVDESGAVQFNDAAGLEVVEFVKGLFADGVATAGDDEQTQQAFLSGKTAMTVTTTTFLPTVLANKKFKWTAMPMPAQSAGQPVALAAGGVGIGMFATEERREQAAKALECLFEKPVLEQVVTKLGYLPIRPDMEAELGKTLSEPPYAQAITQYDGVGPWFAFPGPDGAQANQVFLDAWVKATTDSDDPAATMNEAAEQITGILGG